MHLLPHKSWNPYSQKNIDKVRKDEREHEQKEREEKKRKLGYVRKYKHTNIEFNQLEVLQFICNLENIIRIILLIWIWILRNKKRVMSD